MSITEFILARIAKDEQFAREHLAEVERDFGTAAINELDSMLAHEGLTDMAYPVLVIDGTRVRAECEAKRRIVELHESWPVLVEGQPTFEAIEGDDPSRLAVRASQQIAWLTQQEYRARFGSEPPTAPMMRALALVYADHPDFQDEWRNA